MAQGQCLCGELRYELDGPYSFLGHCHCSMCRKHHGSLFATFAGAAASGFRWLAGESSVGRYRSSEQSQRGFCPGCGSVAPLVAGDLAIAPAGNLDGDIGIRPQMHIFVASKAPWYEITDDLPRHAEYPPEFGASAVDRPSVAPQAGVAQGSCLCGGVAFEVDGQPDGFRHCHCQRCRRARSAAHASNIFVDAERLRFVRGEDLLVWYPLPGANRFGSSFCGSCGSAMPRKAADRPYAVIPAGSLDTDPGLRPTAHIFVVSKAPWFEITGELAQYPEYSAE